jgi:hypothetical protein
VRTARLHIDASFALPRETRQRVLLPIVAALPLAALVAFVSLVGILSPSIYARETPNWAAQAVGQDWVDLLFAVPWLSITGPQPRRAIFDCLEVLPRVPATA